jgi:hypothetical protein
MRARRKAHFINNSRLGLMAISKVDGFVIISGHLYRTGFEAVPTVRASVQIDISRLHLKTNLESISDFLSTF